MLYCLICLIFLSVVFNLSMTLFWRINVFISHDVWTMHCPMFPVISTLASVLPEWRTCTSKVEPHRVVWKEKMSGSWGSPICSARRWNVDRGTTIRRWLDLSCAWRINGPQSPRHRHTPANRIDVKTSKRFLFMQRFYVLTVSFCQRFYFSKYKLAPYGTDGRLFATDVSAKFKVTWHKQ